jgi:pyruvate dehydrogenase E2 component (dihydrolipoamide acetyltransferase)
LQIVATAGTTVPVGAPIGEVAGAGEPATLASAHGSHASAHGSHASAHGSLASAHGSLASAHGSLASAHGSHASAHGSHASAPASQGTPADAALVADPSPTAVGSRSTTAGDRPSTRVQATPLARRVAASLQIDLASLVGTGPYGRVVKRDVLAVAERDRRESSNGHGHAPERSNAPEPARTTTAEPAQSIAAEPARGAVTVAEPTRIQTAIARRMVEAKSEMPEFTLEVDVDMDAAVSLRHELKRLEQDVTPSVNDLVVRACALALRDHPWANGSFRDGHFERYERVNIGVAVAAPGSLLVPTIYDADVRSLGDVARTTRRLAQAARDGRLTPAELDGATFTVSNLGMFGIRRFTAVLNPPQAAILAVGAVEERPVVREGQIVPGHRMAITLTCDHRILYGADAAAFLAAIRANLEAPLRLAM